MNLTILAAAIIFAFGAGYYTSGAVTAKRDLAALRTAQAAYTAKEKEYADLSATYEALRAARLAAAEERTRTIEKIVERPVYHNVCMDDDGVRLINSTIRATDSSEPTGAVPTTTHPR